MKEAKFKLEFTSHVLANGSCNNGKEDIFQRDSDNKIVFQQSWWYTAFNKAISLTGQRGIKPGDISMDLCFTAPTEMYARRYFEPTNQTRETRTHEAISPGTVVEFNAIVADHITPSVLELVLDKMGTFIGLSPYGHNLGFGKFKVRDIKLKAVDPVEAPNG